MKARPCPACLDPDPDWNAKRSRCKRCDDRLMRKYHASVFFSKYGATMQALRAILKAQGGRCAICRKRISLAFSKLVGKRRANRTAHVDHCHKTGTIRGILCRGCNQGLGQLGDTLLSVGRALAYLRRARARRRHKLLLPHRYQRGRK